jgi:NAD(P)-dependent dehydrogenase (short-subunit alcohol dehydrogenase family)
MSPDRFELAGRTVIITGGAGLLGRHYARALVEADARVVIADIDFTKAASVAAPLGRDHALPLKVDITDPESARDMVRQTVSQFGGIDGLVNNAALDPKFDPEHADEHVLTFENYPLSLWQQELDVNLTGMFLCAQAVAPQMLQQKKGAIVNISSTYGMVGPDQRLYVREDSGPPRLKPVTYTVTKSAVFGLTKYLATYWRESGIRVNTLTLGGVYNNHEEAFVKRYSYRTPMGRMADADEYSGALIYLLSDASSYMTGSNLVVDGGWTAW